MNTSAVDQKLSDILEIETEVVGEVETIEPEIVNEVVVVEEHLPAVVPDASRDSQYDYEFSRTTHRDLIESGQVALTELLKVAKESQHPRAYEVVATLLNSLSTMTDKLMALQKAKREIEKLDGQGGGDVNVGNVEQAVFVGSTSDLLKQIRNQ
jgi:hypothetical protein